MILRRGVFYDMVVDALGWTDGSMISVENRSNLSRKLDIIKHKYNLGIALEEDADSSLLKRGASRQERGKTPSFSKPQKKNGYFKLDLNKKVIKHGEN